jgi:hypothetical protein
MAAEVGSGVDRIGVRERRQLGLTLVGVAREVRELKAADLWTDDKATNSAAVMAALAERYPDEWKKLQAANERDWAAFLDQILAFIEKLMALFSMFGGL